MIAERKNPGPEEGSQPSVLLRLGSSEGWGIRSIAAP